MTFEAFIPAFSHWLAAGRSLASLIGIRTDESLHRYMALTSPTKLRFEEDKPWTTASPEGFSYTCYPSMTGGPATSGSLIISRASPTTRSMT
jgi:predicted phosphoadenosine phosphosulfate sulfurtransferase